MVDFAFVDKYGRFYKWAEKLHPEDDYAPILFPGFLNTLTSPPIYRDRFYENEGTEISRLDNRLFVGDATYNTGNKTNVGSDWLTQLVVWPIRNATAAITSPIGRIALTVGSETKWFDPIDADTTQTTIGLAAFAMANNVGTYPDDYFAAYALYAEGRVYPNTVSTAFAAELEAINMTGAIVGNPTPYHDLFLAGAQGLRIGSGGGQGLTVNDALAAISIVNNDAKFSSGLIFTSLSITGTDGVTGFGSAIMLAKGHTLDWYYDDGVNGARSTFITSTATQPIDSFQFQDGGNIFVTPAGKASYSFRNVSNAINGVGFQSSITGEPVIVESFGDDSNVDIAFKPKNLGNVRIYADYIFFYSDAGNTLAAIQNSVTNSINFKNIIMDDAGISLYSNTGGVMFGVAQLANAVNYPILTPAIAGAHPRVDIVGASANIDWELHFKGTGTLSLYAPTTTSATAGGATALPANPALYVTMRIGGTLLKTPFYNV